MHFCVEVSQQLVVIPVPELTSTEKGLLASQPRSGMLYAVLVRGRHLFLCVQSLAHFSDIGI